MRQDFVKLFEPVEARKDDAGNIVFDFLNHTYMIFTMGKPLGWKYEYAAERIGQVCMTNADALISGEGDIKVMTDLLLSKISIINGSDGTPLDADKFDEHINSFPAFGEKVGRASIPKLFFMAVFKVVQPDQYDFFLREQWENLSLMLKGQSETPQDNKIDGMENEKTPSDSVAQT